MPACGRSQAFGPAGLTYAEALGALARALKFGIHPGLDTTRALVSALGDPHHRYVTVQVAGTNGKTSAARILAALLRAEGMATALYTSPHLERYNERMEIDGEPVSDDDFACAVSAAIRAARVAGLPAEGGATEFELLTAGALWLFGEKRVDVAVLEVGLGGRWDATSVVSPSVAVITGIALDHTDRLGHTLPEIAAEKAAIIRPASAPVLGPGTAPVEQVFLDRSDQCGTHARAVRAEGASSPVAEELTTRFRVLREATSPGTDTVLDVRGVHASYTGLHIEAPAYQAANVATAIAAAEATLGRSLAPDAVRAALRDVAFPGRFELVSRDPLVVVDGSHNPEAAAVLADTIESAWPEGDSRPVMLLGVLADKDVRGIVSALATVAADIVVTAPESDRALGASALAAVVAEVTGTAPRVFACVGEALDVLLAEGRPLVVTGSLTTAGEARSRLYAGKRHRLADEG